MFKPKAILFCISLLIFSCNRNAGIYVKNIDEQRANTQNTSEQNIEILNKDNENNMLHDSITMATVRNIEGHFFDDYTDIELIIEKDYYTMLIPDIYNRNNPVSVLRGKVRFFNENYLVLEGIRWAIYEIDGVPQELPNEVDVHIQNENELIIQNSIGNSMNGVYDSVFSNVSVKWINLNKID